MKKITRTLYEVNIKLFVEKERNNIKEKGALKSLVEDEMSNISDFIWEECDVNVS